MQATSGCPKQLCETAGRGPECSVPPPDAAGIKLDAPRARKRVQPVRSHPPDDPTSVDPCSPVPDIRPFPQQTEPMSHGNAKETHQIRIFHGFWQWNRRPRRTGRFRVADDRGCPHCAQSPTMTAQARRLRSPQNIDRGDSKPSPIKTLLGFYKINVAY